MIATIQHPSHLGVDTDTALHHRDILLLEMDTRGDTMKSLHKFHGKLNALTILFCGPTLLKTASSKQHNGWMFVVEMESPSTSRSLFSEKMK